MTLLAGHVHDVSGFGFWEWFVVGLAGLLTAWVIWRAVVLTIRPDEDDPNHLKRMILDDDPAPAERPRTQGAGPRGDVA